VLEVVRIRLGELGEARTRGAVDQSFLARARVRVEAFDLVHRLEPLERDLVVSRGDVRLSVVELRVRVLAVEFAERIRAAADGEHGEQREDPDGSHRRVSARRLFRRVSRWYSRKRSTSERTRATSTGSIRVRSSTAFVVSIRLSATRST